MEFTPVTEKHCFACETTKPAASFSKNKARKDGLQTQCNTCLAALRKANSAKACAYQKQYRAALVPELRAQRRGRRAANMAAHRAREQAWRAAHRTTCNAKQREYQKANMAQAVAHANARKALKLQAMPGWADKDAITTLYLKAREWSAILGTKLHVDHSVPLKARLVCGLHTPDNLQLLSAEINLAKSNLYWPDMPGEV